MADTVLLATKEEELLRQIGNWDRLEGADLVLVEEPSEAYSLLEELDPLILIIDRRGESQSPMNLIRKIRRRYPHLEIALMESERSDVVRENERKAGVDQIIEVPLTERDLKLLMARRIRLQRFRRMSGMVGRSDRFAQIIEMILHIARTDISVLVTGESGTGKELVAKTLHDHSKRSESVFLALNCGALPEGTLESELFGHEKGAFTGAQSAHPGHFERADGGTLFLDEIGEISHSMQIRLLRVLETGEFLRMGGTRNIKTDVRLVAATNRNLELEVREGRFRRDLLHRIKVFELRLPALRERREDIPLLVEHFIRETHERESTDLFEVDDDLMEVLNGAPWPGNIRELRNIVQRMCIMAGGKRLNLRDLPEDFLQGQSASSSGNLPVPINLRPEDAERELLYRSILSLREDVNSVLEILRRFQVQMEGDDIPGSMGEKIAAARFGRDLSNHDSPRRLEDVEREMIQRALEENRGHRRRAADQLGISERTLYRKIKDFEL
ncbi:sigma-54-dependent Fis family transcriptional regulator [bacterium]|nr:sigma-54-dependent Fis family transcriptional regulator [bacterium]